MAKPNSKMLKNGQEFPPKFLKDEEFFSKLLLSKEKFNSYTKTKQQGEASFRVLYYGGATGSVPFMWESQPGTPKHTFNDNPLPPLTPPPSYRRTPINPHQHNINNKCSLEKKQYSKNSKICHSIFSRNHSKKIINVSPTFSPSSSVSSSYSQPSTPGRNIKGRLKSLVAVEAEEERNSPTSTLCFGTPRNIVSSSSNKFKGYYHPIKNVKKAVLSIVGQAN